MSERRAIDERVERGALAARISWAKATRPTRSLASPAMRRQRERGGHGVVELAAGVDPRRHQASAVEQQHHVLAALDLVLRDHQLAAPRGGLPIDRAEGVAVAPFAQRLELGSGAAQLHAAQSRFDDAVAEVELAVALDRGEVGIDADRFGRGEFAGGGGRDRARSRTRRRACEVRRRRARPA